MNITKKYFFNLLYSFVLIPLFLTISIYFTMACFGSFSFRVLSIKCFLFNYIFIEFLNFILFFICKKSRRSLIIICVLIYLVCFINQVKISYMEDPLFVSDFNFIQNYSNISSFTGGSLFKYIFLILFRSIPIILLYIFMGFISFKFNIDTNKKYSFIYGISIFLVLILLLYPFSFSKKVYFKYVYSDVVRGINDYAGYKDLYVYYGIFGGIYYQYLNSLIDYSNPSGYDKNYLEGIEKSVENNLESIGKPNVIVILSESFFDINKISDDVKFDKNPLENYDRLKEVGDYVNVISPAFGGETANVVYELLVGGNISYFSNGYVPFLDLYRDNRERDSLLKVLKNGGYSTSLIVGADSYNSGSTMKKVGFDKFSIIEDNVKGKYTSDDYMADLIIEEFEKNKGNKFVMVETMQNHMPYLSGKYSEYDIDVMSSTLDKDESDVVRSYAQGLVDADKMLDKVYNYISKSDEDTILLFFGDHLPPLKNYDLESLYPKINYFSTKDELTNTYRKYNTEALILSNYDMKVDFPDNLGYDLLLNYVVNHMDVDVPKYYKWLYTTGEVLPTYNRYVAIDSSGKVCYTNKLKAQEKEILKLRNMMFYKEFIER